MIKVVLVHRVSTKNHLLLDKVLVVHMMYVRYVGLMWSLFLNGTTLSGIWQGLHLRTDTIMTCVTMGLDYVIHI